MTNDNRQLISRTPVPFKQSENTQAKPPSVPTGDPDDRTVVTKTPPQRATPNAMRNVVNRDPEINKLVPGQPGDRLCKARLLRKTNEIINIFGMGGRVNRGGRATIQRDR